MCVGFVETQFTCCERDPGGARLWVTVFKCQLHLKWDITIAPHKLSSLLSSVRGLAEARHFLWEEPFVTEPSSLGMVLPSSATASARCLVQVKGHLVALIGNMPMFHPTVCGQSSHHHGGKCELGCCEHLVKAAVWPFLLGVSLTVGLGRTLGIPRL